MVVVAGTEWREEVEEVVQVVEEVVVVGERRTFSSRCPNRRRLTVSCDAWMACCIV